MKELEKLSIEELCTILQGVAHSFRAKQPYAAEAVEEAIRRLSIKPRESFNDEAFSI